MPPYEGFLERKAPKFKLVINENHFQWQKFHLEVVLVYM